MSGPVLGPIVSVPYDLFVTKKLDDKSPCMYTCTVYTYFRTYSSGNIDIIVSNVVD